MKISVILFALIAAISCNTTNKENMEVVNSIEYYLRINEENQGSIKERLVQIEQAIKRQDFLEKFPVPILNQDTVSIHSEYTAVWTIAAFNPSSLPIAILKSNNRADTVLFNQECGCFPFEISNIKEGKNNYEGEVYDNGREFVFSGSFYAF